MKNKINIAEILKDKPNGIRLYSPIFGKCVFCYVREVTDNICVKHNGEKAFFNSEGLYNTLGEVMLFPSKSMQDWSKFSWKKGDVLVSNEGGAEVIFDKWYDDTYTNFYSKHYLNSEDENNIKYNEAFLCTTERYSLEDKDAAQSYINTIEKRLGGKLNLETLEIEKYQPEFKDGDIVVYEKSVAICRKFYKHTLCFYVSLNEMFGLLFDDEVESSEEYRFATEEEKRLLFNALANEGKAWDAEKKQIVELKPKKSEFKIFQKVLVRNYNGEEWIPGFFFRIHNDGCRYILVCGEIYKQCIPYNDHTEHLLGTTDEWKGGEQ